MLEAVAVEAIALMIGRAWALSFLPSSSSSRPRLFSCLTPSTNAFTFYTSTEPTAASQDTIDIMSNNEQTYISQSGAALPVGGPGGHGRRLTESRFQWSRSTVCSVAWSAKSSAGRFSSCTLL